MNDNEQFILKFGSSDKFVSASGQINTLKGEHERLLQENTQLKKSIQNEKFLHSKLYKDWKELKESKEAELEYNKAPRRKLSGAAVILILTLLALTTFAFYNFFFNQKSKDRNESKVSAPVVIDTLMTHGEKTSELNHSNIPLSNTSFKKKNSIPSQKK